jgi:uncharacterized membrane protein
VVIQSEHPLEETNMFRKTMIALFAVAAAGLVSPTIASARGGGHGGGGGFHGGAEAFTAADSVVVVSAARDLALV